MFRNFMDSFNGYTCFLFVITRSAVKPSVYTIESQDVQMVAFVLLCSMYIYTGWPYLTEVYLPNQF